ncbi:MAG: NAD-binding protein [Isosphaeraceae bacterium]|nr:NAD-binding protein [Isosphaeraceae bacterium]
MKSILLGIVAAWNRHHFFWVIGGVCGVWIAGSALLHWIEDENPNFDDWGDSLWSVGILLFSGLDETPKTLGGRVVTLVILVVGVGSAGLFTASIASILVERYLRRRMVNEFSTDDHLVVCNWSTRGVEWIREVHAKIVIEKRPVVIIHDAPEEIELPDAADEPAFTDVFIVKGDPTNEIALRRAMVPKAHSVVIFTDDREGKHADGKSILTCIAVRSVCRGETRPNVTVECRNAANRLHLQRSGADEIISSEELGLRLLARSALFHGMTRVYQELLTVGRNANEMYLLPAPESLFGKSFPELCTLFARYRNDKRACLLIGIQRDDEMLVNPIDDEAGPLREGDQLILLGRVILSPSDPLPIDRGDAH